MEGLYDGENQLVAPVMSGHIKVPSFDGFATVRMGRPFKSIAEAQFNFLTNGVAA